MSETKTCGRCQTEKISSEFWRRKGILQAWCKACHSARHKGYYESNKTPYLERAKERRDRVRKERRDFISALKQAPCQDCGVSYPPYVMDFDHRDRSEKTCNVSTMVRSEHTKEMILAEVAKCDLVCSNCHRIRSHQRGWPTT